MKGLGTRPGCIRAKLNITRMQSLQTPVRSPFMKTLVEPEVRGKS